MSVGFPISFSVDLEMYSYCIHVLKRREFLLKRHFTELNITFEQTPILTKNGLKIAILGIVIQLEGHILKI